MTDFREIERLRKDPQQVINLCKQLLNADHKWREDELDFLQDLSSEKAPRALKDRHSTLTTRQIEWLVDLRDSIGEYSTTPNTGFSVARLIEQCWLNRFDLDNEQHIEFLDQIRGRTALKKRQIGLLLHIARQLHEIEEYV